MNAYCVIVKVNKEVREWTYPQDLDSAYKTAKQFSEKYFSMLEQAYVEGYLGTYGSIINNKYIAQCINLRGNITDRLEHLICEFRDRGTEILLLHKNRT